MPVHVLVNKDVVQDVSVPFRGSRSEISKACAASLIVRFVSVPFRGSRSEMDEKAAIDAAITEVFPSPFGVHVLKSDAAKAFADGLPRFRPLSGFTF